MKEEKEYRSAHDYKVSNQIKSYQLDKNSFLDQVASKDHTSRVSRNDDYKYHTQHELKKNKIYESRKSSHRESRKRSSSRDRVNESPKKYSSRSRPEKHGHRSRSKTSGKTSN